MKLPKNAFNNEIIDNLYKQNYFFSTRCISN